MRATISHIFVSAGTHLMQPRCALRMPLAHPAFTSHFIEGQEVLYFFPAFPLILNIPEILY